ncbi:MAG: 23S rRNA (adenine(2030)-N(6))-methyltransferase RlmJ [Phenylobacterium sp.]|uniref:23S rRNA (adenine(2030)-N(6))-methyltransferase RlmJ n=1 Tax=Phenylobacterium sp. TaxID=1871053 RepID=UPI002715A684|nr:23S rRNA (adenine(2030)-N(6))-methyltransferase RlmJ [Phenylobacterium sp.]MDO9430023.1 23S rRNA (adenine(2030)-N(6))-methyltransferase RlmJ [Phenylobacterium sp.]
MNYRHAFHAGNFADLVKHAALLDLLATMQAQPGPLNVIDTHAGRGLYDLSGDEAQRSGEGEAGIGQLMKADDLPGAFQPLRAAVSDLNDGGATRYYPGSPLLVAGALRAGDSYLGCELRPEEHDALKAALKGKAGVKTVCADGFNEAASRTRVSGSVLILIDPPFEKSDDYRRIVTTISDVTARNPKAVVLVWLPLKDLETFDAFVRDAEDAYAGPLLVAEARMRPLSDPMKMNGCALVVANAPAGFIEPLTAICEWTVSRLGDQGLARVWTA